MCVPRRCKSVPKQGVSVMSTSIAAKEAFDLLNAATTKEWRGWGDTRTAARDRAAKKAGVTPAQAERLWKNWQTMKHPNGDVYRSLRNTYGHLCAWIENAADSVEAKRLAIEESHEVDQSPSPPGEGSVAARD
ncbi:hypothetical protein C5748_18240 [Phyllobacterium phragmitis]|uniref:Uncharacterized protein n=2 Tax=Phyllobacterium phragmitis TaxID=2670329 RepID=A0A2S9INK0_9HYPH|nr:hypothetical protein C5748_18240 [Phyllobacterium phragmitis]